MPGMTTSHHHAPRALGSGGRRDRDPWTRGESRPTGTRLHEWKGGAMKGIVGATAIVLVVGFAGAANAQPSGSETITTTLALPSFPSTAPYVQTYSGTFTAAGAVADSGTVTDQAHFAAVPSPVTAVLEQVRTLAGSKGTLTLRCTQSVPPGQPGPVLTNIGNCVVLDATGAYAGLRGSGHLTGTTDFSATPVTVRDTVVL